MYHQHGVGVATGRKQSPSLISPPIGEVQKPDGGEGAGEGVSGACGSRTSSTRSHLLLAPRQPLLGTLAMPAPWGVLPADSVFTQPDGHALVWALSTCDEPVRVVAHGFQETFEILFRFSKKYVSVLYQGSKSSFWPERERVPIGCRRREP